MQGSYMQTSSYEILVPRYIGETKNHVLVKLTLLHDWHRADTFIHSAFLVQATTMLSRRKCLMDKCEISLRMTDIVRFIVEESDKYREAIKWDD